jgi:hypothetical protein
MEKQFKVRPTTGAARDQGKWQITFEDAPFAVVPTLAAAMAEIKAALLLHGQGQYTLPGRGSDEARELFLDRPSVESVINIAPASLTKDQIETARRISRNVQHQLETYFRTQNVPKRSSPAELGIRVVTDSDLSQVVAKAVHDEMRAHRPRAYWA